MKTPIDILIDKGNLKCTICKAKMGECDCWTECTIKGCEWSYEKGTQCNNPEHEFNQTKEMSNEKEINARAFPIKGTDMVHVIMIPEALATATPLTTEQQIIFDLDDELKEEREKVKRLEDKLKEIEFYASSAINPEGGDMMEIVEMAEQALKQ